MASPELNEEENIEFLLQTPIPVDTIIEFSCQRVNEPFDFYQVRMWGFAWLLRCQLKVD